MNSSSNLFSAPSFWMGVAAVWLIVCIVLMIFRKKQKDKYQECLRQKEELEKNRQEELQEKEKVRQQEVMIEAQKLQILAMGKEIEEARKIRHDYRQELLVLEEFARSGDREAVSRYLPQMERIEKAQTFRLCENVLVNTLLLYYFDQAKKEGIDVDSAVEAGETLWVSASDLSVLLGNLCVNAITAARECEEGKRKIRLRTVQKPDYFAVTVGNTFGVPRTAGEDGLFASTKAGHQGIGLSSIRRIAEKYEGTAVFRVEEDRFRSNVIIFRRDYE